MFDEIEAKRAKWGIPQKRLCERAKVHPTRYTARKRGRTSMRDDTIRRLNIALDELVTEFKKETADA